jgi:hypothetical protein
MRISQLTSIAWCANALLDRREQSPFTFDDIYEAAANGCLVMLLLKIDRNDIISLWANDTSKREEMEAVLQKAVRELRDQELRAAACGDNALCMVIAIVLQAIQERCEVR